MLGDTRVRVRARVVDGPVHLTRSKTRTLVNPTSVSRRRVWPLMTKAKTLPGSLSSRLAATAMPREEKALTRSFSWAPSFCGWVHPRRLVGSWNLRCVLAGRSSSNPTDPVCELFGRLARSHEHVSNLIDGLSEGFHALSVESG